jgi:hypothetical protein
LHARSQHKPQDGTHLSMMSCALACSSGRDITPCRAVTCANTQHQHKNSRQILR